MRRSSVTSSITADTARAASGSSTPSATGNDDCISNPRRPGRYGQISSVTNGITGCSSPSTRSSTYSAVSDAWRFATSSSP